MARIVPLLPLYGTAEAAASPFSATRAPTGKKGSLR
jgi:hypothetical protein